MNPLLRARMTHRLRFIDEPAGDAEGPKGGGVGVADKAAPAADESGDKPLGPAGERALHAERDARKELERTVTQMQQAQKDQAAALAAALGIKPDAKNDEAQTLTSLQAQVEQMRLESTVFRLAAQHQISDANDIELLKSAKDEDAMGKLAARLAAKAEGDGKAPAPKPDRTQGGGNAETTSSVSAGRSLYAERHKKKV